MTGGVGSALGALSVVVIATTIHNRLAAQDFSSADSIVQSGITRGVYPGAVLVLGRRDRILHARGYGQLQWGKGGAASVDSTLWDLASLTKVVGTTPAVMLLVERGTVALDAPVSRYLPRFSGGGKDRVTLRMLLNHTSGLRSYVPFFQRARTRDSAITLLYAEPLQRPAGARAQYSDLNFLLLGLVIERVTGEPLDRAVSQTVLKPAGLSQSRYGVPESLRYRTAPTGRWRGHPMCCAVNDQNAVRFGGAAGHAGLFSTGSDLARVARIWLNHGSLDGQQVLQQHTVQMFVSSASAAGDRLLGWERPDSTRRGDSAYGRLLSRNAYGHTGWTGTLMWIDPDRDLFLILLTNRSFAPRMGNSIRQLRGIRGALADAVVRATDR